MDVFGCFSRERVLGDRLVMTWWGLIGCWDFFFLVVVVCFFVRE